MRTIAIRAVAIPAVVTVAVAVLVVLADVPQRLLRMRITRVSTDCGIRMTVAVATVEATTLCRKNGKEKTQTNKGGRLKADRFCIYCLCENNKTYMALVF